MAAKPEKKEAATGTNEAAKGGGGNTNTAAPVTGSVADPLMQGQVDVKSYSGGGAAAAGQFTQQQLQADIPEFVPQPPPPGAGGDDGGGSSPSDQNFQPGGNAGDNTSKEKPKEKKSFNPDMQDLSDSEKEGAAEKMAQGIMTGYKFLNNQAERLLKVSPKKIDRLQMEGEVDISLTVPWDINQMISLGEFFKEYNNQCDGIFIVEKEFEQAVMPPLTRVLAKRGHGWSDEHFLAFMFGQDVLKKGMQFREIKSSLNNIIEFAKQQTAAQRASPVVHQPVQQQQQQQQSSGPIVTEYHQPINPNPVTLQEKALASVDITTGKGNKGMPTYGGGQKIRKINKAAAETGKPLVSPKTAAKAIIDNSKRKVAAIAPQTGVPNGLKKKGRPKGAKNKPKLPGNKK